MSYTYMLMDEGFSKIAATREYLPGWIEAKLLKKADRKNIAAFIHK